MTTATSTSPLLGKDHKSRTPYPPVTYEGRNLYHIEQSGVSYEGRTRSWRRFCHFLLITILAAAVLFHFRRPIERFFATSRGREVSSTMDGDIAGMPTIELDDPEVDWDCVNGDLWNFEDPPDDPGHDGRLKATTSFEVPADAERLAFFSRGIYSFGHIDVVAADSAGDNIQVDIEAGYYSRHALDRARACRFRSRRFGEGVAILTPRRGPPHRHHRDNIYFHLTIRIPPQPSALRQIPSFHTFFSLFSQAMNNLTEIVEFGNTGLSSTNMKILVKDIRARDVSVRTTNAEISGSYNTSSSLTLATTNAPIKVDVTAYNQDNVNTLRLLTSNSLLAANLSLLASPASSSPGAFNVTAVTTNGRLQVNHLTSPPDSILNAKFTTSNSPAYVRLDPAYEGSFMAATSNFAPHIQRIENPEDPAGRNRNRAVHLDFVIKGVARGTVGWEPLEHERGQPGSVVLTSSNSPVYLTL